MNTQQAIEFLKQHQPLKSDSEFSELGDEIRVFDEVRKYFKENKVNPYSSCASIYARRSAFICV